MVVQRSEKPSSHSSSDHVSGDRNGSPLPEKEDGPRQNDAGEDLDRVRKLDSKVIRVDAEVDAALERLPPHERDVIKRQLDVPPVKVTYVTLFRYATKVDIMIFIISSLTAIAAGCIMPLMTVVFGQLSGTFQGFALNTLSPAAFTHDLERYSLYFIYLGIGMFVTVYVATAGFICAGEHVAQKTREHYLAAIMRQNIGFFDKLGAGEITTRITADTNLVQAAISEKVSLILTGVASFIAAFVIGFIKSWKLTLILSSTVVAIVVIMGIGSGFLVKYSKKSLEAYGLGGTVVEEVLSSIRNAIAFGTQEKLATLYDQHLTESERWGFKSRTSIAVMIAWLFGIIYLNYALAFWMGSRFLASGDITLAAILTTLLAIIIGAFALGHVGPNIQSITSGVAAAAKIYNTIDRVSPLDPTSDAGDKLDAVEGVLELRHVKHIYPSRPEVTVVDDVSIVMPAGRTTALVGASGSGKSTVVGLVERFYDPVAGEVLLDGHDVQTLNLRWLRQQMSLVSQEPTLFGTTIYGNIRHGLIGTKHERASDEEQRELVINAAKMANAHDFVTSLPEGYETNVGERGFLLSGGQKQRIAIARAVVGDPRILLLDEATSALDTKSEGVVQAALDAAARGRTTVVIAHRLSTIKTADNIVVMSQGRVVEQGTHDELIDRRAAYYNLVEAQRIAARDEQTSPESPGTDDLYRAPTTEKAVALEVDPDDANLESKLNRTQSEKSASSVALQGRSPEETRRYSLWTLVKLIGRFNVKEWHLMIAGLFASIIAGGGNPVQAIFFSKAIVALSVPPELFGQMRSDVNFWCWMYFMLALVIFLAFLGQGVFGYCSERLIHRARYQAFRTMLRQDISFFDKEENTAGALTSFLSTEAVGLAGLSGATLGTILTSLTTLIGALALGISVGWKLGLVCTATIPIVVGAGFCHFYMIALFEERSKRAYESSASYACEATSAIRTVASLTRENDVCDQYHRSLEMQRAKSLRSVLKSSSLYAASQAAMYLCNALAFWYGGTLLRRREYSLQQFFICFSAIIFGAQSAGTIFSFAPDMGKSKQAAQQLKKLFDRKPPIDIWSEDGERIDHVEGYIELRDVHFRYPTRPEQPVLRGLNLTVKPGQYVALVGASGCGKSTTISLLERFYDPLTGGVFVDGKEISSLHLNSYRKHLALVSQEPTLYQGTIRENVLLGAQGDDVSDEAIVQACKDANIYDFIMSLPDGFATQAGSKGTMLSGGQKQRIAIARALIRDPKILLLDEATSALDSESEKVVQAALDAAAQGRTTIAVAHRLSTIQKADMIYVFDQGRVVEHGTHRELLARKGRYFELVNLQSLGKTH